MKSNSDQEIKLQSTKEITLHNNNDDSNSIAQSTRDIERTTIVELLDEGSLLDLQFDTTENDKKMFFKSFKGDTDFKELIKQMSIDNSSSSSSCDTDNDNDIDTLELLSDLDKSNPKINHSSKNQDDVKSYTLSFEKEDYSSKSATSLKSLSHVRDQNVENLDLEVADTNNIDLIDLICPDTSNIQNQNQRVDVDRQTEKIALLKKSILSSANNQVVLSHTNRSNPSSSNSSTNWKSLSHARDQNVENLDLEVADTNNIDLIDLICPDTSNIQNQNQRVDVDRQTEKIALLKKSILSSANDQVVLSHTNRSNPSSSNSNEMSKRESNRSIINDLIDVIDLENIHGSRKINDLRIINDSAKIKDLKEIDDSGEESFTTSISSFLDSNAPIKNDVNLNSVIDKDEEKNLQISQAEISPQKLHINGIVYPLIKKTENEKLIFENQDLRKLVREKDNLGLLNIEQIRVDHKMELNAQKQRQKEQIDLNSTESNSLIQIGIEEIGNLKIKIKSLEQKIASDEISKEDESRIFKDVSNQLSLLQSESKSRSNNTTEFVNYITELETKLQWYIRNQDIFGNAQLSIERYEKIMKEFDGPVRVNPNLKIKRSAVDDKKIKSQQIQISDLESRLRMASLPVADLSLTIKSKRPIITLSESLSSLKRHIYRLEQEQLNDKGQALVVIKDLQSNKKLLEIQIVELASQKLEYAKNDDCQQIKLLDYQRSLDRRLDAEQSQNAIINDLKLKLSDLEIMLDKQAKDNLYLLSEKDAQLHELKSEMLTSGKKNHDSRIEYGPDRSDRNKIECLKLRELLKAEIYINETLKVKLGRRDDFRHHPSSTYPRYIINSMDKFVDDFRPVYSTSSRGNENTVLSNQKKPSAEGKINKDQNIDFISRLSKTGNNQNKEAHDYKSFDELRLKNKNKDSSSDNQIAHLNQTIKNKDEQLLSFQNEMNGIIQDISAMKR